MKSVLLMALGVVAAVMVLAWFGSPSERWSPTGEARCSNVVIDWVEAFQVDGVRYYLSPENRDVTPPHGPEVARVQYNIRENVCDPFYRLKDGDATFLKEGTPIHVVDGYSPEQVLAAVGRVYEARPEGGAVGADQLPFDGGVRRIAILSQFDASELASIDAPALVDAFVDAALDAPIQDDASENWNYLLEFQQEDGLRFRRTYNSATGEMREGIRLPEAARQIVRQAANSR
jgi:hypothetical protein